MHEEIKTALRRVPAIHERIKAIEEKIKKHVKLPKDPRERARTIVNYAGYTDDKNIFFDMQHVANSILAAKPDFAPIGASSEAIEAAMTAIGTRVERMVRQLELAKLLELKNKFKYIESFYDDALIKKIKEEIR
ncbi:hypothetical protein [Hydrogenimonas urashimensis]|uniref:hypothetical protein n=1 Tax=Hydrogenimonas urashimensis TaxID=2740515 RepID=UPI001914DCC6|nr:hypothetical protein [Hydrogenimonas urashimensis]